MILTDKCKDDFLVWYFNTYLKEDKYCLIKDVERFFETINKLFQNALIIEFFDFSHIIINIETSFDLVGIYNRGFDYTILNENSQHQIGSYFVSKNNDVLHTRLEATEKAIIHANKIYNETKI